MVESLDEPRVESFDAFDFEYFDAEGKRLRPTVADQRVSLTLDPEVSAEPEGLNTLVVAYVEAVIARGDFRQADRTLLDDVKRAGDLRDSVIALGRFIDQYESRGLRGWLTRRRRP